jgi:hypothetical protein
VITIPRSLARQVRAVFRHGAARPHGLPPPLVELLARPEGLRFRLPRPEFALEHLHAGAFAAETLALPLEALAAFEGKSSDPVAVEAVSDDRVLARWQDGGVPQAVEYDLRGRDRQPDFPALLENFVTNPPSLLRALDDAARSTATDFVRFATHRVLLRGRTGEVVATDGKQLLVQKGFSFPWSEDLLVPRLGVFGCRELSARGPSACGSTPTPASRTLPPSSRGAATGPRPGGSTPRTPPSWPARCRGCPPRTATSSR